MSQYSAYRFYLLVKEMRQAQRRYYETKEHYWLTKAYDLQQRVDDEIFRTDQMLKAHPELIPNQTKQTS